MKQVDIQNILTDYGKNNQSLLFVNKQEQDEWFKKITEKTEYKPLLDEIKEEAKRLVEEPEKHLSYSLFKLFHETGSRKEYEKVYFAKRRRLNTFTLMVLLDPDNDQYLEKFEDMIWSICNEYSWCLPAHLNDRNENTANLNLLSQEQMTNHTIDLFAAETGFTLSEILRLTEDNLDPILIKRIYQEIYQRIIWPYLHNKFAWETATHNWASVCAGSIGSMALHLYDDDKELSIILERVLDSLNYYLAGFNDDGTCLEGYGYWQYGFGYYVYFADLLKNKTKGKINLFKSEKVHQIALFQQKSFLNSNKVVNFSDAPPTSSVYLGLSHYLSHIYPDFEVPEYKLRAHYTEDHCSRWAPAFRNLLWFDPELDGSPWSGATYYLKESQWLISRHLTDGGTYAFATKGGNNDEPHNHNDIGHFILTSDQDVFLKDLGNGLYNKAYFSSERYSFICNGSQGHSVPIINNQFQTEGSSHAATVEDVLINEKEVKFSIDMTRAYPTTDLHRLVRHFTWIKTDKPTLTILDTYMFNDLPHSIVERLIIPPMAITEEPGLLILEGNSQLKIFYDQDKLAYKINEFEFTNHFAIEEKNIALDFIVKKPQKNCQIKLVFQFDSFK